MRELNYYGIASSEMILDMEAADFDLMIDGLKHCEVFYDEGTFEPYKIYKGLRYDLEPITDLSAESKDYAK